MTTEDNGKKWIANLQDDKVSKWIDKTLAEVERVREELRQGNSNLAPRLAPIPEGNRPSNVRSIFKQGKI